MEYEQFRHFADSWGLVYLFAIFIFVLAFVFRPGSGQMYRQAAQIPFDDDTPSDKTDARKTETKA